MTQALHGDGVMIIYPAAQSGDDEDDDCHASPKKQMKALKPMAHFYINAGMMDFFIKKRQMIIHSTVSSKFNPKLKGIEISRAHRSKKIKKIFNFSTLYRCRQAVAHVYLELVTPTGCCFTLSAVLNLVIGK